MLRDVYLKVVVIDDADGSDAGDGRRGLLQEGSWDAIHVIEVNTLVQKGTHFCCINTWLHVLPTMT